MKLSLEDQRLLEDLCLLNGVSFDKVLQLLAVEQEFEFRDRRVGIFDALRKIMRTHSNQERLRGGQ